MGRYNRTSISQRPDSSIDGDVRSLRRTGTTGVQFTLFDSVNGAAIPAFVISAGSSNANRDDIFLVNKRGVTWTKLYYSCSGADYAELFSVHPDSKQPAYGDLMTIDDEGRVSVFDDTVHSKRSIIGVVSIAPTLVGDNTEFSRYERDPKTLQILLDDDGNPVLRQSTENDDTVQVALLGRVPLHRKYMNSVPDRWIVLHGAPESKMYEDFVYVMIR